MGEGAGRNPAKSAALTSTGSVDVLGGLGLKCRCRGQGHLRMCRCRVPEGIYKIRALHWGPFVAAPRSASPKPRVFDILNSGLVAARTLLAGGGRFPAERSRTPSIFVSYGAPGPKMCRLKGFWELHPQPAPRKRTFWKIGTLKHCLCRKVAARPGRHPVQYRTGIL